MTHELKIACMHYPTTTVFIDDNPEFLSIIQSHLHQKMLSMMYSNPVKALDELRNMLKPNEIIKNVTGIDMESIHYSHASRQLPLHYNIENLYHHCYNKERFNEIGVIVIDFEMPTLNGAELCEQLKYTAPKIIMLTGEANEGIAVQLFNAGLIDHFISKVRTNWEESLIHAIEQMQKKYFQDLTYPILNGLEIDPDSALSDPAFIQFFHQVCQDFSISSYYLLDVSGSFLLFDHAGTPTWLLIKTCDELKEIANEMQVEETEEPMDWIKEIQMGKLMPYFNHFTDCLNPKKSGFEKHLYPASLLHGKRDYSYSLVKDFYGFPLDQANIMSFSECLLQSCSISSNAMS